MRHIVFLLGVSLPTPKPPLGYLQKVSFRIRIPSGTGWEADDRKGEG